MLARTRWIALVAIAIAALAATAVAGCGSGEKGTDVEKIAFVAPYLDNEPDWTLQAVEVVEDFPKQLGVRVDTADASEAGDVRDVLEQVSNEDNQLVIAHDSRYADAAEAVAKDTDVPALVWGERPNAPEGLVGQITVQDKEGGYLAGIVAARAAVLRSLGIVVIADGSDWDLETWNRMAGGFVAGARSIDPRTRFRFAQVGSGGSATADEVHDAALRMQDEGMQMVFALGGSSTLGALRAIEERGGENQFIGVVGDKADFNRENFVLASVMYDTRAVFREAVRDVRNGTFGERPYTLTLRNRGIWLLSTGRTPSDAYEAAMEAGEKIERGNLQVPITPTSEDVEALIAGEEPPQG